MGKGSGAEKDSGRKLKSTMNSSREKQIDNTINLEKGMILSMEIGSFYNLNPQEMFCYE